MSLYPQGQFTMTLVICDVTGDIREELGFEFFIPLGCKSNFFK